MKRIRILNVFFAVLIVFSGRSFAQMSIDSTITIEQILRLPEKEIDIGLADLVLAKDFYPNLKIESFLYTFRYMADRFNYFFGHYTNPDQRVRALNTFLYRKGVWNDSITFGYDDDDLHVVNLSNKFINGYLATKKGSCITLPMMYVILAERLDLPVYASRLPYHFFIRYVPEKKLPKFQSNIEATNGGGYASDKEYQRTFLVPNRAVESGVYLRTLSKKEYLASLLLINSNEWISRKNIKKAKYYLELSMKYDSTFTSAMMNYATIHLQEAIELERKMNEEKQDEITFYNLYTKNRSRNQASLSPQLSSPLKQTFKIPELDYSAFQIHLVEYLTKTNKTTENQVVHRTSPSVQTPIDPELQISLADITQRYAPLIQNKLEIYYNFKKKAEDLGIVRDYPMSFFQVTSKSLKIFQEKGEK